MTLAELQERLQLYLDAEKAVLMGHQSYGIGTKSFTRANLGQLQTEIRNIRQQISTHPDNLATGGAMSHSGAVFGGRR